MKIDCAFIFPSNNVVKTWRELYCFDVLLNDAKRSSGMYLNALPIETQEAKYTVHFFLKQNLIIKWEKMTRLLLYFTVGSQEKQ